MRRYTFPFLAVLFLSWHTPLLIAQSANISPVADSDHLNGKVQQVVSARYEAVVKNGEIVAADKLESIEEDYLFHFDTQGNKLQEQYFEPDGSLDETYIYTYDKNNKLLSKVYQKNKHNDFNCQTLYEYNQQAELIAQHSSCFNTAFNTSTEYRYNEHRQLAEILQYDNDKRLYQQIVYQYNQQQKILSIDYNFPKNAASSYRVIYKYDKQILCEKTEYYANGKIHAIQTFDRSERLISVVQYEENGKVLEKLTHEYDSKGNVQQTTVFGKQGKMQQYTRFSYDKKNRLRKTDINYPNDRKKYSTTYDYTAKGNVSAETIKDISQDKTTVYKYTYDKQNNWIKKVTFEDQTPKDIVLRNILYY